MKYFLEKCNDEWNWIENIAIPLIETVCAGVGGAIGDKIDRMMTIAEHR